MKLKALFIGLFIISFTFALSAQNKQARKGGSSAQVTSKQAAIQQQKKQAKADGKITPKERIQMKASQKKASKAVARKE